MARTTANHKRLEKPLLSSGALAARHVVRAVFDTGSGGAKAGSIGADQIDLGVHR